MKKVNPLVLYAAIGFAGYFLVIKPLLESLNVMDTKDEKDAEKLRQSTEKTGFKSDYWNPNFTASKPGFKSMLLNEASARALVDKLWNASGSFNDDEEAVYAVFRTLRYKTQVSFLAYWFNKLKKKDLYTWLRDSVLNQDELNTVLTITSKLPEGFVR
jgi:hypothetical protein